MGKTATINVRVDESDKKSAEQVLKQLGMPMSTLITKQVSFTKSVPFDITLPEAPTSVSVEGIFSDEFGQMMVEAYQEAENSQVRSIKDRSFGIIK
ncbi:type II toxin-antitoxin system RelB/DinJ family antitoxin [Streptococcus henryi]|uniref:type II toxin-antitoxin system RelB/DinJ family antitoxin n=1 Tax=Streptococcus henryi TaxID=439219 RepID=UPI00036D8990|nr:type II toxin-antitoxin system RelB/DinJ family antitoxin [Streptococcus henryi]